MARPKTDDKEKKAEGAAVKAYFDQAKQLDKSLTVDSLAHQLSVSQGLVSQWFTGSTRIRDKHLFALGLILEFEPAQIRPELSVFSKEPAVLPGDIQKPIDQFKAIPAEDQEVIAALIARAYKRHTKPE